MNKIAIMVAAAALAGAGAWYAVRSDRTPPSQGPGQAGAPGSMPGGEGENTAPAMPGAAEVGIGANAHAESVPGEGQGFQLTGKIRVAPELADRSKQIGTVYVMVRSAAGGPPYAVSRLNNPRDGAEIPFELTPANVMLPDSPPPADARVIVRFDADGSAGPEAPGDLVGEAELQSLSGAKVDVLVSREGGVRPQ